MSAERLTGRRNQQARADLFRAHPYCQRCEDDGRQVQATVRKHRVPLDEGGTEAASNILALCLDCAEAQHALELARGVPVYGFTKDFQQSARPRDEAGHFSVRRATRLETPDADTPTPPRERATVKKKKQRTAKAVIGKPGVFVAKTSTSVFAKKKPAKATLPAKRKRAS